jgi:hypothetical protein
MNKIFATVLISLVSMNSLASEKEVIFFNEHTIHNVKFKDKEPSNYFDFLTCGNYHCYGIKGETLYSIGFNGQGQLGAFNKESKKEWSISMKKNVSWVRANKYGGCLKTKDGKLFETGKFDLDWTKEGKAIPTKNGWTEVDSCEK